MHYDGCHAYVAHGFLGDVDHIFYGFDFLAHVVVLILYLYGGAVGELVVDFSYQMLQLFFAAFESVAVMVAYYVCDRGFPNAAA